MTEASFNEKKSSIIAHPKSSIATFLIAREIKMLTNVLNVWSLTNQRAPTNLILGSSNAFEHKNLSFEFEFWFHYGLWPITDQQLISLWSLTNHRKLTHVSSYFTDHIQYFDNAFGYLQFDELIKLGIIGTNW